MNDSPDGGPVKKPDPIEQLIDTIKSFPPEIFERLSALAHRGTRNNRNIWILAAIVASLGILVTGVTVVAYRTASNSHRIEAITTRLDDTVTAQRQNALCPLYGLFLDANTPQARESAPDKDKYDNTFKVIQAGYDTLRCAEVLPK